MQFHRLGEQEGFMEPDSDEDEEQEKKAEVVNSAAKDWGTGYIWPLTPVTLTHGFPKMDGLIYMENLHDMDDLEVPPF